MNLTGSPITETDMARHDYMLTAYEDAVIRAARDTATTPELRTFMEQLIAEREANKQRRSGSHG